MASSSSELALAQARWTLHLLPDSGLPEVATKALLEGFDTPTLRLLAGSEGEEPRRLVDMFQRSMAEVGLDQLNQADAARRYAAFVSRQIVEGRVPPVEGARRIIAAIRSMDDARSFHDLDPFIYAESDYDSRQGDRELLVQMIREEASRWAVRSL